MWKLFFILCLITEGQTAINHFFTCDVEKCQKIVTTLAPLPKGDLQDLIPNEEGLKSVCPSLNALWNCLDQEFAICYGQNIRKLVSSNNESIAAFANIFLGMKGLTTELCDENTHLHRAYVSNIHCIKHVLFDHEIREECDNQAQIAFSAYVQIVTQEGSDHNVLQQAQCLITAYKIGCVSDEVLKKCGKEARWTLLQFVKRMKTMKYEVCTEKDLEDLQTTFLDSLKMGARRRRAFKTAFDLKKK